MDEIIKTNRELRKQLAEDDEIISKYETRIKSLVRDLEHSNLENHYLGKSLIQREAEIETLKKDNTDLSIQLRKALQDIESKEKFIAFREDQFITLEDKISTYNKKPKMSSPRQIQPPNPNEIDVSTDSINTACRSLDEFIQRPNNSNLNQRSAVSKLNEITTFAHRLRDIAKWESDQLAPLQTQLQQNLQALGQVNNQVALVQNDLNRLHQDYTKVTNERDTLNQAHNNLIQIHNGLVTTHNNLATTHAIRVQAHNTRIQAHNADIGRLNRMQQKYIKWKQRAINRNANLDVIWFVNTPN
jgi:chromosome segregation ATPase